MQKLLLEIGVEELPASFIEPAVKQLQELIQTKLTSARINWDNLVTFSTPRRLAIIGDVADQQLDLSEEVKGPPKNIAYQDGQPTKAALGFARSQGVSEADLFIKEIDGAEYLMAKKFVKGRPTTEVLVEILPEIITSLSFPKNMRWGNTDLRYGRPIRWILALLDSQVLSFTVADVESGNLTYGHRQLAKNPITVSHPGEYEIKLKEGYVIANQQQRRELIKEQVSKLAAEHGKRVILDESLLKEVTNLVEYPTAFRGQFESEYLSLPSEVLITSMKEHQRYFSVLADDNNLSAEFIGVRNGADNNLDLVISGNEKVLRARLADAKFFYEEDQKRPLAENLTSLKTVVFQEGLGTVYDKVERITNLASKLCEILGCMDQHADVVRTARLAKADLVTQMVYEFPELQGVMGSKYAEIQGETEEVVIGIVDHYKPRFAADELPRNISGMIVSLADKLDSLVGYFGLGKIPTGSQDPFALRRQALGVVQIILSRNITTSLRQLIETALAGYDVKWEKSADEIIQSLLDFFNGRLKGILLDKGYRYDSVDAVLALGISNLPGIEKRIAVLEDFRKQAEFDDLHTAYERCINLAKKAQSSDLYLERFTKAEEELYAKINQVKEQVKTYLCAANYTEALMELASLRSPVDQFFDQVMIMDKDEQIRQNRLALLKQIIDLFASFADFSQIVIDC